MYCELIICQALHIPWALISTQTPLPIGSKRFYHSQPSGWGDVSKDAKLQLPESEAHAFSSPMSCSAPAFEQQYEIQVLC